MESNLSEVVRLYALEQEAENGGGVEEIRLENVFWRGKITKKQAGEGISMRVKQLGAWWCPVYPVWGLHVVLKENRTGEAIFKDSNKQKTYKKMPSLTHINHDYIEISVIC